MGKAKMNEKKRKASEDNRTVKTPARGRERAGTRVVVCQASEARRRTNRKRVMASTHPLVEASEKGNGSGDGSSEWSKSGNKEETSEGASNDAVVT